METISVAAYDRLNELNEKNAQRILDLEEKNERVRAQLEVATDAMQAAVSKAEWQARTNRELNEHLARNNVLRAAIEEAIESGDEGDWQSARRVLLAAWQAPNASFSGGPSGPSAASDS